MSTHEHCMPGRINHAGLHMDIMHYRSMVARYILLYDGLLHESCGVLCIKTSSRSHIHTFFCAGLPHKINTTPFRFLETVDMTVSTNKTQLSARACDPYHASWTGMDSLRICMWSTISSADSKTFVETLAVPFSTNLTCKCFPPLQVFNSLHSECESRMTNA